MGEAKLAAVLGGAGFLGSHLTEALLARGHAVRVFDRPNADRRNVAGLQGDWHFLGGDVVNEVDLEEAVRGVSVVYHLVSTTIPATSNQNPVYDVESNLVSTLNLLDLSLAAGVERVVFVSSGGTVYGRPETLPIPEDHPTRPRVSYGVVKLAIENYLRLYHDLHGLATTTIRLANPYGPRQDPAGAQGAASVFLGRALRSEPITVWGDGSVVRDYVYVDDAVAGIVAAAERGGDCGVYNVGSGRGASLTELLDTIAKVSGRTLDIRYQEGRAFDVPKNVLDIRRAGRDLGWKPEVDLETGLRRTWEWLETGRERG